MSSQAPPLPVLQAVGKTRSRLVRRAKTLSLLSIAWMTAEAAAAIIAALLAGSVALLGFGLDSLIELVSASTILWLYTGARSGSETAERRAQQLIAICFAALALYVAFDAIDTLARASQPQVSWPGVAVSAVAVVLMPLLARAKGRVATELGSTATAGDAAQSYLCAVSAAAVLLSILGNAALGWWWLDPIAALGIAGLAVYEGHQAWAGQVCTVMVYLIVNAALWGIWAATGAGYAWPAWVTGAWGIGLLLNAWDVYFRSPITEADVQREIERLHPQH